MENVISVVPGREKRKEYNRFLYLVLLSVGIYIYIYYSPALSLPLIYHLHQSTTMEDPKPLESPSTDVSSSPPTTFKLYILIELKKKKGYHPNRPRILPLRPLPLLHLLHRLVPRARPPLANPLPTPRPTKTRPRLHRPRRGRAAARRLSMRHRARHRRR